MAFSINDITGGLNVKDIFNSYVASENAKVQTRMKNIAATQKAALNAVPLPQNPQAKTHAGVTFAPTSRLSVKDYAMLAGGSIMILIVGIAIVRAF